MPEAPALPEGWTLDPNVAHHDPERGIWWVITEVSAVSGVREIRPTTSPKPLSARQQRVEKGALTRSCPTCSMPPTQKCINLAPSHRAAGVAYETKMPHPARCN